MELHGFPYIVGWELTMACNLRCKHCASASGTQRANELTRDEALAICDMFPDLFVKEVDFTGGEPLMCSYWDDLALHLGKMNITTRIISNGLLLTNDNIEKIKDAGISSVGVSIDGLESIHDYIRGSHGSFRHAIEGLKKAAKAGIETTVITSGNALNVNQLPEIRQFLNEAGIRYWQIQPTIPSGRCRDAPELHLTTDDYLKLGNYFHQTRCNNKGERPELIPADSLGYFTELDILDPPWEGCPAGQVSCGITSDGKVKGCLSLPDEIIEGELRKRDLWDIWFDNNSFAYARNLKQEEVGDNCRGCEMLERCKGGCSAISYGTTGQFRNDPYCFFGLMKKVACQEQLAT